MRITVGSKVFIATLSDNATATAFKALQVIDHGQIEVSVRAATRIARIRSA